VWPEIERITACALGATLGRGAGFGKGDDKTALRRRNLLIPGATFELFGLDFMLKRDGSPALIEINTSPALFRHGAVLRRALPLMMEEVCRLTLDRVFPPPTGQDRVESERKGEARFRELDVVVDLAVESSGSAVRAARSSASPEKIKKQPVPRAATRANTRVVSFGKGVGSDPAA
jgi:tubulin--tyrosine ligase